MRMSQQLEVLNLPFDSRGHVHVDDLLSIDDLHRDLVSRNRVDSHCGSKRRVEEEDRFMVSERARDGRRLKVENERRPIGDGRKGVDGK